MKQPIEVGATGTRVRVALYDKQSWASFTSVLLRRNYGRWTASHRATKPAYLEFRGSLPVLARNRARRHTHRYAVENLAGMPAARGTQALNDRSALQNFARSPTRIVELMAERA